MTNTWTGDATQPTRSESWFSTTSPDVAIHIGETSFYSHRLRLLGHSNSFGLTGCLTCVGPITVGDITYETDVALDFGEPRASYTVHVPMEGVQVPLPMALLSARRLTVAWKLPLKVRCSESSRFVMPPTLLCARSSEHMLLLLSVAPLKNDTAVPQTARSSCIRIIPVVAL